MVQRGGRFSGEAYVLLGSPMQLELAVQKNRQHMGKRYVEVFPCRKLVRARPPPGRAARLRCERPTAADRVLAGRACGCTPGPAPYLFPATPITDGGLFPRAEFFALCLVC
jgi:hypothetical protein